MNETYTTIRQGDIEKLLPKIKRLKDILEEYLDDIDDMRLDLSLAIRQGIKEKRSYPKGVFELFRKYHTTSVNKISSIVKSRTRYSVVEHIEYKRASDNRSVFLPTVKMQLEALEDELDYLHSLSEISIEHHIESGLLSVTKNLSDTDNIETFCQARRVRIAEQLEEIKKEMQ